jgi:hypothetical protein
MKKKAEHNEEVYWIKNQYQQHPSMEWSPIYEKDVTEALKNAKLVGPWKRPNSKFLA